VSERSFQFLLLFSMLFMRFQNIDAYRNFSRTHLNCTVCCMDSAHEQPGFHFCVVVRWPYSYSSWGVNKLQQSSFHLLEPKTLSIKLEFLIYFSINCIRILIHPSDDIESRPEAVSTKLKCASVRSDKTAGERRNHDERGWCCCGPVLSPPILGIRSARTVYIGSVSAVTE
jgi:hypothetical protein